MVKKVISLLVEAGNMKPGPALGTTLGPMGINMGQVTAKINQATAGFKGMRVPVSLVIDINTKNFDVEVKQPPVSQLIKKELGFAKGSGAAGSQIVGDITSQQVIKIAKEKVGKTLSKNLKEVVKEVAGTCLSTGVTIDGKNPKQFIKDIESGSIKI
ncbi:MAG: 50S ribosomal protein L11 [Candidatus Nanoarchaeia archaeon]|nr:50S ribosomal protein L11 [Candidatus Nanoarchaeia archaeon]